MTVMEARKGRIHPAGLREMGMSAGLRAKIFQEREVSEKNHSGREKKATLQKSLMSAKLRERIFREKEVSGKNRLEKNHSRVEEMNLKAVQAGLKDLTAIRIGQKEESGNRMNGNRLIKDSTREEEMNGNPRTKEI